MPSNNVSTHASLGNLSTHDSVRGLLRLEGLGVFAICLGLYAHSGASWATFAALFLLPDISLAGYLFGPRVGAAAYNSLHSELGPLLLAGSALTGFAPTTALSVALIWGAHVGFDRTLGYGLKYARGFGETHLGLIGKTAHAATSSSLRGVQA